MRTCRAHYPGGSKRVHVSIASPSHAAFPKLWVGRHPHCPFRGLLRLHSRYGPHARSTAQGGLCHGASTEPVARPRRPLATSSIDNSLGGTLLHRCFAPTGRTRDSGRRGPTVICVMTIETTSQLALCERTSSAHPYSPLGAKKSNARKRRKCAKLYWRRHLVWPICKN